MIQRPPATADHAPRRAAGRDGAPAAAAERAPQRAAGLDGAPAATAERPVFVAETPHRARMLRVAGRVAVAASCAWLAALVLGGVGFVGLPAMRTPLSPLATVRAPRLVSVRGGRTAFPAAHVRAVRDRDREAAARAAKPA